MQKISRKSQNFQKKSQIPEKIDKQGCKTIEKIEYINGDRDKKNEKTFFLETYVFLPDGTLLAPQIFQNPNKAKILDTAQIFQNPNKSKILDTPPA